MFVNGLGTANPPQRYSKVECCEAFRASGWFQKLTPKSSMSVGEHDPALGNDFAQALPLLGHVGFECRL